MDDDQVEVMKMAHNVAKTHTETLDGNGAQHLPFAHGPNVAIVSLTIDGLEIPGRTVDEYRLGYRLIPGELQLRGYVFTRRQQNVVVTYTAAGVVAGDTSVASARKLAELWTSVDAALAELRPVENGFPRNAHIARSMLREALAKARQP